MFTREQLIFKALAVLHEANGACHAAPAARSLGLRFALAYLAAATGGDRAPFDRFWTVATRPLAPGENAAAAASGRTQEAQAALNAIDRLAGRAGDPALERIYWAARVATGSAVRSGG